MEILRIIDANFNRIREGLRVIEDSIRFIYGDEKILKELRDIKHQISIKTLQFFPSEKLKSSRFVEEDIGKKFDKKKKINLTKLIETNFLRVEESLRVLEEYSKILNLKAFSFFHNIRFKIYKLEKDIITHLSRKKIKVPLVYVILNLKEDERGFLNFAEDVIKGEPDIIQLRYKGENSRFFLKIGKKLKKTIPDKIIYIINDRVDIGILCECDGVHIGENDIGVEDVRKLIPSKILGVSANSVSKIKKLKDKDIDYIALGAIFKSYTKPDRKVIGTGILKKIKSIISIPVIGIGGINIENAREVIEEGADGIAVISAVESSKKPYEIIKRLREEVYKGWRKRGKTI